MTAFKFIILIFIFNFISAEADNDIGVNVGTVLFTELDDTKKCWTNEQLALLRSRFVFQDLLPDIKVLTMENDKFVTTLLDYFRLAMQKVKTFTTGKTRQLHVKALSDAIGGYLKHAVIPLANHAFYMGHICLDSAEKIKALYDTIKAYLRTDGKTWANPISSLPLAKTTAKRKRSVSESELKGGCDNLLFSDYGNGNMSIPLPFLDSNTNPTTIAVPLRYYPLHNIHSPNSVNILSKFYDIAIACLNEKNAMQESTDKFKEDYAAYLESDIIPHTKREELIPALGGVFPLVSEIKHGGQPSALSGNGSAESTGGVPSPDETEYYEDDKSTAVMFTAVGVVILIWIITGIIYCCCRMRRKQKKKTGGKHKKCSSSRGSVSSNRSCLNEVSKKSTKGDVCPKASKPKQSPKQSPKPSPRPPPAKKPEMKAPKPKKASDAKKKASDAKKKPPIKKPYDCTKCAKCKGHSSQTDTPGSKTPSVKGPPQTPPKTPPKTPPPRVQSKQPAVTYALGGPVLPTIKSSMSAPQRMQKSMSYIPGHGIPGSKTSTEKPVVFGYDFETTTSDSSSFDDTSSYTASGRSTPKA